MKFTSQEQLRKFSDLASEQPYGVYVSTSYEQLDARSLLALFTILNKTVNVVVSDHIDYRLFNDFMTKVSML